jgi:uncharacterized protein YdbL (DUF1318 family)
MDTLSEESIRWGLAHINRYGDTDIFPTPFEFAAISSQLTGLLPWLCQIDLSTHRPAAFNQMMMPKEVGGFRAATQLDPVDSLLFASLAYEMADNIESFRGPLDTSPSCAYRVDKKPNGQLFSSSVGWDAFHTKSVAAIAAGRVTHVLSADISDFYNQISLHRICNALESAGLPPSRCATIETLLSRLNGDHHSRGIPVGQSLSILLAEATLVDVDNQLLRLGFHHVRYVDDFRVFCSSRAEAVRALHELSLYLFVAHRLSLQAHKTKIRTVDEFSQLELSHPEEVEARTSKERLVQLVNEARREKYRQIAEGELAEDTEIDDEQLEEENRGRALRDALSAMCTLVLAADPLPIGMARFMLRRAAEYRTRIIMDRVLGRAERFLPIIRDFCAYVTKLYDRDNPRRVGDALLNLAQRSDYRALPLVQYWIVDAFCRVPALVTLEEALAVAEGSERGIRDRLVALVWRAFRQPEAVRARKQDWQNTSPWAQRAIVYAGSVLPNDEKQHWLNHVAEANSPLNRAVAMWSRSQ